MSGGVFDQAVATSGLAGKAGLRWRHGLPTVASPMRQAVDAENAIVECDEAPPLFLKVYEADGFPEVDLEAVAVATAAAANLGVGPALRFVLPAQRALATDYLEPPWRAALLNDFVEPSVFEAAVVIRRTFQRAPALPRRHDVFAMIEAVHAAASARAALPSDAETLLAWSREAAAAIHAAGLDLSPCHNDGSASAYMIDGAAHLMLVDFDEAGQSDPVYDLALLLNEASAFGDLWALGLEIFTGAATAPLINRCRLYAIADDIYRGIWGWLMSATSPRRSVEFLKYGEWRLLRGRMALREPGLAAISVRL
jgi:hypothetical protein